MPTWSEELINHISNMVVPQVNGLSNEDSTWKIVTHKKRNKKQETFFTDEEYPSLPKSSSAKEYQSESDDSSNKTHQTTNHTRLSKNLKLISLDIDGIKHKKSSTGADNLSEDDMSTNSSPYKTMKKEHQVKCKRKIIHLMKDPRHVLLSKEYQKKQVKKEDGDIEEIIQKIENELISTLHDMGNRTTRLEYL